MLPRASQWENVATFASMHNMGTQNNYENMSHKCKFQNFFRPQDASPHPNALKRALARSGHPVSLGEMIKIVAIGWKPRLPPKSPVLVSPFTAIP